MALKVLHTFATSLAPLYPRLYSLVASEYRCKWDRRGSAELGLERGIVPVVAFRDDAVAVYRVSASQQGQVFGGYTIVLLG